MARAETLSASSSASPLSKCRPVFSAITALKIANTWGDSGSAGIRLSLRNEQGADFPHLGIRILEGGALQGGQRLLGPHGGESGGHRLARARVGHRQGF